MDPIARHKASVAEDVAHYRLLVERLEVLWEWSPEDLVHDLMTRTIIDDQWATLVESGLAAEVLQLDERFLEATVEHTTWRSYAGRGSTQFWWRLPKRLGKEWHEMYLPDIEAGLYEV